MSRGPEYEGWRVAVALALCLLVGVPCYFWRKGTRGTLLGGWARLVARRPCVVFWGYLVVAAALSLGCGSRH